jgi:chaperonin GroES
MDLMPLYDRVVLEPVAPEDKSPGGIVIPEMSKGGERFRHGKVLSIGQGRIDGGKTWPMTVKVGDVVLFNFHASAQVKLGDKEVAILAEKDILAIVK